MREVGECGKGCAEGQEELGHCSTGVISNLVIWAIELCKGIPLGYCGNIEMDPCTVRQH